MSFGRPRVADFPAICHQCRGCFSSLLSWGWGWDNILSFPVFLLLPLCSVQWFQGFCRMWVIFPHPSSPEISDNTRGKQTNSPFPLPCEHFFSEEATSDAAGKSLLAKKNECVRQLYFCSCWVLEPSHWIDQMLPGLGVGFVDPDRSLPIWVILWLDQQSTTAYSVASACRHSVN